MCGAFAMSAPAASNNAHEKSSRSRMLTETAVACSTAPICSATCMNRWLKSSSCAGSARPASTRRRLPRLVPREAERAVGEALGRPAGLDDRRRIGLDDEGRARDRRLRRERGAFDYGHVAPAVEPGLGATASRPIADASTATLASRSPATMASTASVATSGSAPGGAKPKRRVNTARKSRSTSAQRRVRDLERSFRARRTQLQRAAQPDFARFRALGRHGGPQRRGDRIECGVELRVQAGRQRALEALAAHQPAVCEPDAESREHAGERVNQDLADAERVGDAAGMLRSGSPVAQQRELGRVMALADRDVANRARHRLDRDVEKSRGNPLDATLRRGAHRPGERLELLPHDAGVQRLVAARAEDRRERIRADPAQQHLHVGDGERAAVAVAGRTGVRAGGARADGQSSAGIREHGAAAGGNRVDVHHRRLQPDARDGGLEALGQGAIVERNVRRGAAHVEGDQAWPAAAFGDPRRRDQAAAGPDSTALQARNASGAASPPLLCMNSRRTPAWRSPSPARNART